MTAVIERHALTINVPILAGSPLIPVVNMPFVHLSLTLLFVCVPLVGLVMHMKNVSNVRKSKVIYKVIF